MSHTAMETSEYTRTNIFGTPRIKPATAMTIDKVRQAYGIFLCRTTQKDPPINAAIMPGNESIL